LEASAGSCVGNEVGPAAKSGKIIIVDVAAARRANSRRESDVLVGVMRGRLSKV